MGLKNMPNDSMAKTLIVAVGLCLVCSIVVSTAAVKLRPLQAANKLADKQKNIVEVAGIELEGRSVAEAFAAIEARVVDLQSGEFADQIDPTTYDQRKASKDPAQAMELDADTDIASIKMRERYATVYLMRDTTGKIEKLILPVRGYGLWSTLWGFLALEGDGNTIIGLSFYEHAETPGLGGEVDNPTWKASWAGKQVYPAADQGTVSSATWRPRGKAEDLAFEPAIRLVKGGVNPEAPGAQHKVDSLAGATLTSNGVTRLLQFWMGENGFAPFLRKLAKG